MSKKRGEGTRRRLQTRMIVSWGGATGQVLELPPESQRARARGSRISRGWQAVRLRRNPRGLNSMKAVALKQQSTSSTRCHTLSRTRSSTSSRCRCPQAQNGIHCHRICRKSSLRCLSRSAQSFPLCNTSSTCLPSSERARSRHGLLRSSRRGSRRRSDTLWSCHRMPSRTSFRSEEEFCTFSLFGRATFSSCCLASVVCRTPRASVPLA
mmetsp:Transcript_27995/g.70604  ORF Transcript_27995/g.70604 Transcript_27995/m.70604 type:complete len:210 (+) Transcript_27995:276-905(+)